MQNELEFELCRLMQDDARGNRAGLRLWLEWLFRPLTGVPRRRGGGRLSRKPVPTFGIQVTVALWSQLHCLASLSRNLSYLSLFSLAWAAHSSPTGVRGEAPASSFRYEAQWGLIGGARPLRVRRYLRQIPLFPLGPGANPGRAARIHNRSCLATNPIQWFVSGLSAWCRSCCCCTSLSHFLSCLSHPIPLSHPTDHQHSCRRHWLRHPFRSFLRPAKPSRDTLVSSVPMSTAAATPVLNTVPTPNRASIGATVRLMSIGGGTR